MPQPPQAREAHTLLLLLDGENGTVLTALCSDVANDTDRVVELELHEEIGELPQVTSNVPSLCVETLTLEEPS